MQLLKQHIEALVFCSENSISLDEIQASLKISMGWEVSDEEALTALEELRQKYQSEEFSFELYEIAGGYEFLTKKEYYDTLSALLQHKAKKKLSVAQMETLSIIAYKQPISKSEIEHIRGVNCDYAVQKLLEKDLIEMQGKSDGPGRPMLYATSQTFMDYFGIKTVADLPQLKELRAPQNEIGMASELSEELPALEESSETMAEGQEPLTDVEVQAADDPEVSVSGENPRTEELPDRKTIFLASEESKELNEFSSSNDEEENPS